MQQNRTHSPNRSASRSPTRNVAASVGTKERVLIFASPEALGLLNTQRNWCMDGTYTSCPKVFKVSKSGQVFIIGTIIRNHTIPCVYALITRQNKPTFKLLFEQLRKVIIRISENKR